jgi:hypothetical protein
MVNMQAQAISISKLKNNTGQVPGLPKNPRFIRDSRFDALKKSIQDDPEMMELRELIAYDHAGELVVIAGNMRLRALKELGYKEAPVKLLPPETPAEKLRAYAVKDNVPFGETDWELMANDWDAVELEAWGLEVPGWDAGDGYTNKVESPVYEPKNEKPVTSDLVDRAKTEELIADIEASDVSDIDKDFLKVAAMRHLVFDYEKIADYYANSLPNVQKLMEDSALVVIDFGKAIELGYVNVSEQISSIYDEDYQEK